MESVITYHPMIAAAATLPHLTQIITIVIAENITTINPVKTFTIVENAAV